MVPTYKCRNRVIHTLSERCLCGRRGDSGDVTNHMLPLSVEFLLVYLHIIIT